MVHFVGAGPGAADLITVRGKHLIEEADVLIYAGSLINLEFVAWTKEGCACYDSARMTLDEILRVMEEAEENHETTVRLHSGDPSLYGAVREQMDALDARGIAYDTCPGVSAMSGAASALNLEYTLPEISQSVVVTRMAGRTSVPERESIASFAAHGATMVLFLSASLIPELSGELIQGGYEPDTPAALVYKATWPEEEAFICTVNTLQKTAEEHGINRTALIIVGDVVAHSGYGKSKLYDPEFTTGYRKGTKDEECSH